MVKRLQTQAQSLYGLPSPISNEFPVPVISIRAPTTSDTGYNLGQIWVDKLASNFYGLASNHGGIATWQILGSVSSTFTTITATTFLTATAATATQLSSNVWSAVGSNAAIDLILTPKGAGGVTISTGALTVTSGAITATLGNITATAGDLISTLGNITATHGAITATNGNISMGTAGNGLRIKSGANARLGHATLLNGTTGALANTSVTANTRVFISRSSAGAVPGALGALLYTIVPNTSLTIYSVSMADGATPVATDQSEVDWLLVEAL